MVYSYLNGMQEPTSIIVPLLLRFFFLSTNMSQPLFTTAIQPGKGDSILQNEILTLVFTQNQIH